MRKAVHEKAVDVTVTGRVQGVSFRFYAEREARRLGVAGWVRNEPDGSVGGHFEGDVEAVDAMVAWCRTGPPAARVEQVRVRDSEDGGERSFGVRF
ncbi:acylphosphatase [Nocardioides ungokensis]|uniref:acylphosphatase n=1 Tax=Nocardioides ungokensis TaxID=1643322 RepID=UPI0015DE5E1C|nr:acylphosphatase [Nocardioides ungokensis]